MASLHPSEAGTPDGHQHRAPPAYDRRDFLGRLGRGAGLAVAMWLSACELGEEAPASPAPAADPPVDWEAWWESKRRTGRLHFANWPYYIDFRGGRRPSLDAFTRETGVKVQYFHTIEGNESFMEEIEPYLEADLPPFYDLIVMTSGPQVSKLVNAGFLTPLDRSRMGNFERYASDLVRDPAWDPGNRFSMAWQSGLTGIAYRPEAREALGRAPSSIGDLFDPSLQGRVSMMSDLQDLGSAGLLAIGIEPGASTEQDWVRAAERLRAQRADGLVAGYHDQSYVRALVRGDVWIGQAWSGDIFQQQQLGRDLEFVIPEEGAMLWTDHMLIPSNARHPVDAMMLMDFVYRPDIAAMIADWVWYVCPVPSAARIIENRFDHPAVANSPLVFPTVDAIGPGGRFEEYRVFEGDEDAAAWTSIFGAIPAGL